MPGPRRREHSGIADRPRPDGAVHCDRGYMAEQLRRVRISVPVAHVIFKSTLGGRSVGGVPLEADLHM